MMPRVGSIAFVCFLGLIPLANWMIGHVGTVCPPGQPCLVPVAPGLLAPSGVITVGVALVLRDVVQRCLGTIWGLVAIAAGAALSVLVAPASLGTRLRGGFPAERTSRFRRLYAPPAPSTGARRACFSTGRPRHQFSRVPMAGLRQPAIPGRAGRRQTVGGACQPTLHPPAAPGRSAGCLIPQPPNPTSPASAGEVGSPGLGPEGTG